MKKHLEKLRSQPDHHKEKMVKTMALIVTGIIVLAYLVLISFGNTSEKNASNTEQSNQSNSFLETFENGFSEIGSELNTISEQFRNERDSLEELFDPENLEQQQNADPENISNETEVKADAEIETNSLPETENQN